MKTLFAPWSGRTFTTKDVSHMDTPTAQQHRRMLYSIPLFGLLFALFTLIFCLTTINLLNMPIPFLNGPPGMPSQKWPLYLAATLGAMCSGMFFWWLLIVRTWEFRRTRPRIPPLAIGGLSGLLSTIGAHPLMWIFWLFWVSISHPSAPPASPPTQILLSLLFGALVILVFSLLSLLLIGISSLGTMFLFGIAAGMLGAALFSFWTGETGRPQPKSGVPSGTPPAHGIDTPPGNPLSR